MLLLLVVSSSLISFLPFNFSNNTKFKTFLGDGGSLFLGFLVSALLVQFAEVNLTYDPSIVLWFAAVPILDLCAVVTTRLLMKRKITAADRNHIHHYFLSKGYSHLWVTVLITAASLALLLFGVVVISKAQASALVFSADTYFILIAKKSFLPT